MPSERNLNYYKLFMEHHFMTTTFRVMMPGDSIVENVLIDTKTLSITGKKGEYFSIDVYSNYFNLTDSLRSIVADFHTSKIEIDSEKQWLEFYAQEWNDAFLKGLYFFVRPSTKQ